MLFDILIFRHFRKTLLEKHFERFVSFSNLSSFFTSQLTANGPSGQNGKLVQKHVEEEPKYEDGHVLILRLRMAVMVAMGTIYTYCRATEIHVQVENILKSAPLISRL